MSRGAQRLRRRLLGTEISLGTALAIFDVLNNSKMSLLFTYVLNNEKSRLSSKIQSLAAHLYAIFYWEG